SSVTGSIPLVQFKSSEGGDYVTVNNVRFDGRSKESGESTVDSDYNTTIDSVLIHTSMGAQVSLHDINVSGDGRQVGDLIEGGVNYRIADALMDQQSFGSFELGTYVKNIDY